MPEERLNLYQKLAKVRKGVEVVQKNKQGFNYKYVTDDELLAKITGSMDKLGISLIPSIVTGSMSVEPYTYQKDKTRKDKETGELVFYQETINEILVHGYIKYTWVNNDNPEEMVPVDWFLIGHQADGSQSFGSALTYSMRYFLLKYFGVATPDDDPDNWRSKQKEAEKAEERAIAQQIVTVLDSKVKLYMKDHSTDADKDKVRKFFSKYIKSGNYFNIDEPMIAEKVMKDFEDTFINVKK